MCSDFLVASLTLVDRHSGDVCADQIRNASLLPLQKVAAFATAHVQYSQGRPKLDRVLDSLQIVAYQHTKRIRDSDKRSRFKFGLFTF